MARWALLMVALISAGCSPALVSVKAPALPPMPTCESAPLPAPPATIEVGNKPGPVTLDAATYASLKAAIRALQADDATVRQLYVQQQARCGG